MILIIDNFDSFTYNLAQYFSVLGRRVSVMRNNQLSLMQIEQLQPSHIVISPGPGTPDDAGISLLAIKHFMGKIPILGVCLGHQAIAQVLGANIIRAHTPIHGKISSISHVGSGVFTDLPTPMNVTRYHSLVIDKKTIPNELEVTAWTQNAKGDIDEIMAIKHRNFMLEGVQFHPESILSEHGLALLNNFLRLSGL